MKGSIMIQGTMSNAGKSVLAGGLCRVLKQDGYHVAPFKSQNMALNSYITKDGFEMGRAQVMQAEAAGIEPDVCMNPILLKPTSDTGSQVIVNGIPAGVMPAAEYFRYKKELIPDILHAYEKLKKTYDVIVIEGAGSPAEINLKKDDIVNMGLAEMVDAPVLLVGDIDRGGVFAQLVGTIMLLEEEEKKRIKGMVINKFRGDSSILRPGLSMLEDRTGIPVLGTVPYFDIDIDEEDSLTERFERKSHSGIVDIAVIRLPRISNFTDFAPLEAMDEISLRYISMPSQLGDPDVVILPGSKNTISDLLWLRQSGMEAKILRYAGRGGIVLGICGGYQMLGESIADPCGAEHKGTVRGMGLLPVRTVFQQEKHRTRISGKVLKMAGALADMAGTVLEGYEIHMGSTTLDPGTMPLVELQNETRGAGGVHRTDGAQRKNVYGCYVHGIFDQEDISSAFLSSLLKHKGYNPGSIHVRNWHEYKEEQYDRLADIIRKSLKMEEIYRIIEKRKDEKS